jgi:hypothetical protein
MSNLTNTDNKNNHTKTVEPGREILAARWIVILSSIILYFSGLGQLPIYRRYNVVNIPGFSWADQYYVTLQLHYIFSAILIGALIFMVILRLKGGGTSADKNEKRTEWTYKYARPVMVFSMLILVLSGAIKVVKNLPQVNFSYTLLMITTLLHNAATVTLLLGALLYLIGTFLWKNKAAGKSTIRGGKI